MISLIAKINQDFKSSLSSFNRQSTGSEEEKSTNEFEEQELAFFMQEEEIQKEPSTSSEETQDQAPKVFKPSRKSPEKLPKLEHVKMEVITTQKAFVNAPELYAASVDDHPMEESDNLFSDEKEIYDIMEIEGNDDIYVDESGNAILNGEDDDGEFILVNYKSETDEKEYIVEEDESDRPDDKIYDEQTTKRSRKKHVQRMPREIVDRYAQSTDSNQHICTKCVKVFSTRTNLIRHIQSHDGNKVKFP